MNQILQLKNAINNMTRAQQQQQQQLSHSNISGSSDQPASIIIRNKSNSSPSSPNSSSGVSVSLLANNNNNKTGSAPAAAAASKSAEPDDDMDDFTAEDEDHFQAETYADYMPLKLKIGVKHPDPVVETASLSSVHPPEVWYRLAIAEDVIDSGKLSALQLEAITYACQQHEQFLKDGTRAGFLLGDGAGVGKGRTLAGIIHENYLLGRKRAIWLSVSNDLRYDAERDLRDIGAKKINVYPLNKVRNRINRVIIVLTYCFRIVHL